jgi:hypothetical protein
MRQADTEYPIRSRSGPHDQGTAYEQTVHAFDQLPSRAFRIHTRHDYMACPSTTQPRNGSTGTATADYTVKSGTSRPSSTRSTTTE